MLNKKGMLILKEIYCFDVIDYGYVFYSNKIKENCM